MRHDRTVGRDVFLYSARDRDTILGGLVAAPAPSPVTNKMFFAMVDIVVRIYGPYTLENGDGARILPDEQPLVPGSYYIVTNADTMIEETNEPVLTRTISLDSGTRTRAFCKAVRDRDGTCVVSQDVLYDDDYTGYEAAHIFPISHQQHWTANGYSRWITDDVRDKINSAQNGLFLRADLHQLFDSYRCSINPDDNYKIIWFAFRGTYGHADGILPQRTLADARRPADELLRWHFRQAVLANMRGVGEPIFEHDFPPGADMLQDIRDGPKAAERMEAELFGRVALHMDLDAPDEEED